ncbi:PIHD1 protein, partial [Cercotrichas coryphoeus]|nr:PIHD1 protein [Cercotrichas coryphoeus]
PTPSSTEVRDPPEPPPVPPFPEQPPPPRSRRISSRPAGGRGCTAYDVVVNSGFFRTLQADPLYLEFFLTVAMEGLSEKYGVELELTGETGGQLGEFRGGWGVPDSPRDPPITSPGWRVLRNRKFLGSISAQNIRARPRPHIQELPG